MDHIVYLDTKAKELENLHSGKKTMNITKTLLLLLIGMGLTLSLTGQDSTNVGNIGITYGGLGNNDLAYFQGIENNISYHGSKAYAIGISYEHPLKDWIFFASGVEYSYHKIKVDPTLFPSYHEKVHLISVPFNIRLSFLKYFYIRTGACLHFNTNYPSNIDNQTGLGANFGVGVQYQFHSRFSVFINPYMKVYSLVPLSGSDPYQRLIEEGIKFGIQMKLK